MPKTSPFKFGLSALLALIATQVALGYTYITSNNDDEPIRWRSGAIVMHVELGAQPTHVDHDVSTAAISAMQIWNNQLDAVQFVGVVDAAPPADGNDSNEIFFSNTIYGRAFGTSTLAVTTGWSAGHRRTESDIIFNTAISWDSYRLQLQSAIDLRRVAIHELGHVLGLDHPDLANPVQDNSAIMNSTVSGIDTLQPDDILGAQRLYGKKSGFPQSNDNFIGAQVIAISGGTVQVTGSNSYEKAATFEAGEAFITDTAGGHSVWWRWTAPSDGAMTIDTRGSLFDTVLGVYTGSAVNALTQVVANDDESSPYINTSLVTFTATYGTTYFIAVDGVNAGSGDSSLLGETGAITLNLSFVGTGIAPVITSQPVSAGVTLGNYVQFTVAASGTPPPTYQWQRSVLGTGVWTDINISTANVYYTGSQALNLWFYPTLAMNGDQFRCIATNVAGSVTSQSATVSVNPPPAPVITTQPQSVTAFAGNNPQFTLAASGYNPTYQWQVLAPGSSTWTNLTVGSTNSGYGFTGVTTDLSGSSYRCLVTNPGGTVTSDVVVLTVLASPPPVFTFQAQSQSVLPGSNVRFVVLASSVSVLDYQWQAYSNGSGVWSNVPNTGAISGATSRTLTVNGVTGALNGSTYRCVATNAGGSTASETALLKVVNQLPGVVKAAAGYQHGLFIRCDGTLWASGSGGTGVLGDSFQTTQYWPEQVASGVVAAAGGRAHSLFIKADGTLWGMGNSPAALADVTGHEHLVPVQIAAGVVAASAGDGTSFFITTAGDLWGLGTNDYGNLGDGTKITRTAPVKIASDVMAVSAGGDFTLFLTADGKAWSAGNNSYGQTGAGGGFTSFPTPRVVATGVSAIAAGLNHGVILKSDGSLWTFGNDQVGQLGDGKTQSSQFFPTNIATGVKAIAAGGDRTIFVKTDGTLWAAGDIYVGNGTATPSASPVMIASGVSDIAAGSTHSYYLRPDGSLLSWGRNPFAELGDGTSTDRASPVSIVTGPLQTPSPVANFSTAAGTGIPGTRLAWGASIGAVRYEVWRSFINNFATATKLADDIALPLYYDLTAPGGTAYYWVVAKNSAGTTTSSGAVFTAIVAGALGDLNGDLKADILLTNTTTGERAIWLMNGASIGTGASLGILSTDWVFSATGDFNGDGKTDIFLTNTVTGERVVWLMNGTTIAAGASLGVLPAAYVISGVGDFNADGKSDLVLTNTTNGDRAVWLMNGASLSAGAFIGGLPTDWQISGVGDFNADGKADIVLTQASTGVRAAWLMNGTTVAAGAYIGILPTVWSFSGIGDFNGDGKSDVVLTNTTTGDRAVWLMNGTSVTAGAYIGVLPTNWVFSQIGDFDGDGKADIFLTNTTTGDRAIWLMNGTAITSGAGLGVLSNNWLIRN